MATPSNVPPSARPPAPKGCAPKSHAEVLAKRAAAKEAKRARQAAALAECRCDCGKQFSSKAAVKQHRRDASVHQQGDGNKGSVSEDVACSCGRKFKSVLMLQQHKNSAKEHRLPKPFVDQPAMVVMRGLGDVTADLAGVLEGLRLEEGGEEVGADDATVCVLCECGRHFHGWPEMYAHLRSSTAHNPGGQVTVYSGKLRSMKGSKAAGEVRQEGYVGMERMQVKAAEGIVKDVSYKRRRTFNYESVKQHLQAFSKYNQQLGAPQGVDILQSGPPRSLTDTGVYAGNSSKQHSACKTQFPANSLKTSAGGKVTNVAARGPPTHPDTGTVRCSCNMVFKNAAALADHQSNSTIHKGSQAKGSKKSRGKSKKSGGGAAGVASHSYGYTHDPYSYGTGYGGCEDYSICDKDCGWCGHCMDGVDLDDCSWT
ncbi:Zinc finger C2H2-type protein [Macrophomina phaseolina MS6]|uniref:Zinc finger C2H2-type protein n=1 Tax=Macrophomina phaseolina (strain MS6) TaxID=1126212 RepID=K2R8Q3_MACPH|nr:Zinc finger C2H2-type protein [Macrophomina phaseolina MS6]